MKKTLAQIRLRRGLFHFGLLESACRELVESGIFKPMKKIIQVHISKGEKYFVAECVDLPVVTQGKTLDELAKNLREAISLQLEGEDPADFDLVQKPSILASFELETGVHAKT